MCIVAYLHTTPSTRLARAAPYLYLTWVRVSVGTGTGRRRASINTGMSPRVGVRERRFPCQCLCLRELLRLSPWAPCLLRMRLRLYLRVICVLLGRGESPLAG